MRLEGGGGLYEASKDKSFSHFYLIADSDVVICKVEFVTYALNFDLAGLQNVLEWVIVV